MNDVADMTANIILIGEVVITSYSSTNSQVLESTLNERISVRHTDTPNAIV